MRPSIFLGLLLIASIARAAGTVYPGLANGHWKAYVAVTGSLPASGNATGDVRAVLSPASLYMWSGSAWSSLVGATGATGTTGATGQTGS